MRNSLGRPEVPAPIVIEEARVMSMHVARMEPAGRPALSQSTRPWWLAGLRVRRAPRHSDDLGVGHAALDRLAQRAVGRAVISHPLGLREREIIFHEYRDRAPHSRQSRASFPSPPVATNASGSDARRRRRSPDPNPGALTLTGSFDGVSTYMFRGIRQNATGIAPLAGSRFRCRDSIGRRAAEERRRERLERGTACNTRRPRHRTARRRWATPRRPSTAATVRAGAGRLRRFQF